VGLQRNLGKESLRSDDPLEEIVNTAAVNFRRAGLASVATSLVLGTCVAAAGPAAASPDFQFDRIAGSNRYATSAATAKQFGNADTAILASGENGHYADALTASYLSGLKGAPVLLTKKGKTPEAVADQLKASEVKNIVIVGGTGAVSQAQQDALTQDGYNVTRIAGSNRYATAADIIDEGDEAQGDTALLATGLDFADALGAGSLSFAEGLPMGITKTDDMPDNVLHELDKAGVTHIVIVGGEAAVGKDVVTELENAGMTTERLKGTDRAATSVALANYEVTNYGADFSRTEANVASGAQASGGADALGGAVLSGQQGRPLLITNSANNPGDSIHDYLMNNPTEANGAPANPADIGLTAGTIFGGTAAISKEAEAEMTAAGRGIESGAINKSDWTVHDDVNEAIQQAEPGDTLEVFGGTQDDPIPGFVVNKDKITMESDDANLAGPVQISGADNVTVDGFTIDPGSVANQVAGFYLDDTTGTVISDNVVAGNGSGSAAAGVINTTGTGDTASVEGATISGNTFRDLRQGVFANPSAQFVIKGNTFLNNAAGSANDTASTITGNLFRNNDEGVGLGAPGSTVTGNTFENNGTDHVGDYTDKKYDLDQMIQDNKFDEPVKVVDDTAPNSTTRYIKDADQAS
jgi:putative cell wall-binding protein